MGNVSNRLYEFGNCRFDSREHNLWVSEELVLLSPKASGLLKLLLDNDGEFVSKQTIFDTVWGGTFVEEGVLTQNIYTLRKALGKTPGGETLIENKTRLGYRIAVPVTVLPDMSVATVSSESTHTVLPERSAQTFGWRKIIIGAAALVVLALSLSFYFLRPAVGKLLRPPIESVKFTRLTDAGDLTSSSISADGNLLAYIRGDAVYLRDTNTEKELKLAVPNVRSFSSINFSPDGEHLYFRNSRVLSAQASIMRVSRLGGEAETVVERSWGSFSLSPDGKKIAYVLNVPPIAKFNLYVRDLASGEEREFFVTEQPKSPCLVCAPAWSPDGTKIVFATNIPTATGELHLFDLIAGTRTEIKPEKLRRFQQAAWLPDGSSFIVSASDGSRFFHLWKVYYPDGEVTPVTNGLSSYTNVTISRDGRRVLALRSDETANIFVTDPGKPDDLKQVTTGNQNSFGQNGLHWIDERRVLYSSQSEQNLTDNLSIVSLDDNSRTVVTNERNNSFRVPISNGRSIWYAMNKDGTSQIFEMDMEGKNPRKIAGGADGQRQSPRITEDSRYLYYVRRGREGGAILRYDLQNGTEELFYNNPEFQPGPFLELSPDNKYLTFTRVINRPAGADEETNAMMTVVSIDDTTAIKYFPVSAVPPIRRFSPDSRSIDYIYAPTDMTQIVRQSFDGGEIRNVFTAPSGKIFNFAWSKDGKRLALSLGQQHRDAVLLTDF